LTLFSAFLPPDEMKSLWNWGSITCIMCFTCVGSQLSINSSSANSFSGPLQLCVRTHTHACTRTHTHSPADTHARTHTDTHTHKLL
uniref:Uncharacterized protein n=1 Tax=Electrophorus electricus TaxID=8005 RepID=A0A4W4ETD6_ELEEL